ncbi:MAG: hypothetical protein H0U66_08205, partial [Gemmatimonadaceae bacterium]|nr:hypothetical protein [Gemmatimonadaceae bacterium]
MVLLAGARGIPSVIAWKREVRAEATENRQALASAREVLASERSVRDSAIARGKRVIALAPLLLSGDSPASASATLEG